MIRKYLILAMVFISPGIMSAQSIDSATVQPESLTLKEAIQIGLDNNRNYQKALLDEDKAKYQRHEIRGAGLPQLKAYGDYNNFIDVYPQAIPGGGFFGGNPEDINVIAFGVPQTLKAGLQLNQLIYSNSYLIGLKAAKTGEEFYRLLAQQSEEDVINEISKSYLGVLQLDMQKENLLATIEELEGLEKILNAQYENDLARKVDLNRVKVNLTSVQAELENLDIAIYQSEGYLKLVMGIPVDTEIALDSKITDMNHMVNEFQATELDVLNRKDIQVLGIQEKLYEYEYKNIKAEHMPQLVGFADLNKSAFAQKFDYLNTGHAWYQGFLVGLKLEIPIFNGMQTKYKAAQSKVTAQQLQLDKLQATDAAELEYQNALKKYYNSLSTLNSLEGNLTLATNVLDETELLYKESLSPLTDLLAAESSQRQAQANYNNQIIQVRLAQLEILKSTGTIKNLIQ